MISIKHQLISDIAGKLKALGISVQTGRGADLAINVEFLDAGWSTGNKKINYEASIFADEQDNVVYMYEKTTEIGRGLSFGSENESSFQNGKTLFRKVKIVQYGPDGKAFEVKLDLGAIPKAVKETAEQYGFKFKTVINKKKAMYPAGYIADNPRSPVSQPVNATTSNVCANCGAQMDAASKFCGRCGSPAAAPGSVGENSGAAQPYIEPDIGTSAQTGQYFSDPNGAFYAVGEQRTEPPKKKFNFSFAGVIALGVLTLLIFWVSDASVLGWILGAAVFAGSNILLFKIANKGCLLNIILWVVSFVLLFVIAAVTSTDDTTAGADGDAAGGYTDTAADESETAAYLDQGYSYSVYTSATYNNDYENEIYSEDLELTCSIFDQLLISENPADPEGGKVKEIRIKNFTLTDGPVLGTFAGLEADPELNKEFYPRVENGELIYDLEEYSSQYSGWGASLCFRFTIKDIATYTYPPDYDGVMSIDISYTNAGITSDDMRFGCSYDIEITTMAGDKYVKHVEIPPLQGDFLYNGDLAVVDTRELDYTKGVSFEAVD